MDKTIESKIEKLRLEMYKAYSIDPNGDRVVRVSQELDKLILESMEQKWRQYSSNK